ncbi:MAG: amidohydrolase family protein [Chloroflexi bacterium]|nr:amidohydrolase family protein [Chloroflexota bacterium]
MRPIAAEAARLGVPILMHDSTPPFSSPLQVAYLADQFPTLKVVLGHGGGKQYWRDAVAALKRYPNCYLCLGWLPIVFDAIIAEVGAGQLTIHTDAGFGDDYSTQFRMEQIRAMASGLSEADKEAIFWRNASRLVGLA